MRKTTTFRSSLVALAAAGVLLPAANIQAQDTTQAAGTLQTPTVHVVVEGETLWGIAMRYLRDPYLWPQIYRMNTLVVEDPHWIFPGEELRLEPLAETEGDPGLIEVEPGVIDAEEVRRGELPEEEVVEPPTPVAPRPPPTETAPTVFLPDRDAGRGLAHRRTSAVYRYRSLRSGDFYAAGFLTEDELLPWAAVVGAVGRPTLGNLTASSAARIYNEIDVQAPESAVYQVGDSLLVARLSREVRDWGWVVVPSGLAKVTSVAGSQVRAEVVTQFGRISDGQVALPIEHYADPGDVVPVPIENGMVGEVIAARDVTPVPNHRDIIFINLGRSDGVALGDIYEVLRPVGGSEMAAHGDTEQVSLLQIVHVREHSASGLMVNIRNLGTGPGADVRLVRKMPS
jgi:hypothetical protein